MYNFFSNYIHPQLVLPRGTKIRYYRAMQINISRPLVAFQYAVYALILSAVHLLLIAPLSILLFHGFYQRLLPPDSSQWVPISTLIDQGNYTYTQIIDRVPIELPLRKLNDNGLSQFIPLREHIQYNMDLALDIYCLKNTINGGHSVDSLQLQIYVWGLYDDEPVAIFKRVFPIVCLKYEDTVTDKSWNEYGPRRMSMFAKEWQNRLVLDDAPAIDPEIHRLELRLESHPANKFVLENRSGVTFTMEFEQGLRNLMLRWWKLTYAIGTSLIFVAISVCFLLSTMLSFLGIKKAMINKKEN